MTTFLGIVAVPVVCALIQRTRSGIKRRWALLQTWACCIALALAMLTASSVASRGYSLTGFGILAGIFIWIGAGMVIIFDNSVITTTVHGERGWFVRQPRMRRRSVRAHRTLFVWCVLSPLIALWPLRYASVFANDTTGSNISAVVTLGLVTPLREREPIAVDQCLDVREPKATNIVVPCGAPHHAFVVDAVVPPERCPSLDDFHDGALDLRMEQSAEIDGVQYCLLQSKDPSRWRGRGDGPALPLST